MKENIEINGIRDSDILDFLERFNLLETFNNGQLKCNCCGEVITMKNIGGFFIQNSKLFAFCDQVECLDYGVLNYGH